MSPFFIKIFKKEHRCHQCTAKKQRNRSFCPYHLRLARERFEAWAYERRAKGRCISCDCKSFNGYLRCKKHTKILRIYCHEWNKEHGHDRWLRVKTEILRTGLCASCPEHRPVKPGALRCQPCLTRHQLLKAEHRSGV